MNRIHAGYMSTTRHEYDRQLSWRIKQVSIGKDTSAYHNYSNSVARNKRRKEHPQTPDPYDARMSKRQFEGRIKAWRRNLHALYPTQVPFTDEENISRLYFFITQSEASLRSKLKVCGQVVQIE